MTGLEEAIATRLDGPRASNWRASLQEAHNPAKFGAMFASAGRRFGEASLELSDDEVAELGEPAALVNFHPVCLAVRVALLRVSLASMAATGDSAEHVERLFRTGSLDEQVAVLRALPVLPDPAQYLDVAATGVRTNATAVLRAIACDNPFPARYFTEAAFNQLVMKAVFYELPLARVVGLSDRPSPELARMALDFAAERRAAARPVPTDLNLIEGVKTS